MHITSAFLFILLLCLIQTFEGVRGWKFAKDAVFGFLRGTYTIAKKNKTPKFKIILEQMPNLQLDQTNRERLPFVVHEKCSAAQSTKDENGQYWSMFRHTTDETVYRRKVSEGISLDTTTQTFDFAKKWEKLTSLQIEVQIKEENDEEKGESDDDACDVSAYLLQNTMPWGFALSEDLAKLKETAGDRTMEQFEEHLKDKIKEMSWINKDAIGEIKVADKKEVISTPISEAD